MASGRRGSEAEYLRCLSISSSNSFKCGKLVCFEKEKRICVCGNVFGAGKKLTFFMGLFDAGFL